MSKKVSFDLPMDEPSRMIVAALLANAVINRLEKKSTSTQGAMDKVAYVYSAILNSHDALDTWEQLGE